jgi:hypothetical protein
MHGRFKDRGASWVKPHPGSMRVMKGRRVMTVGTGSIQIRWFGVNVGAVIATMLGVGIVSSTVVEPVFFSLLRDSLLTLPRWVVPLIDPGIRSVSGFIGGFVLGSIQLLALRTTQPKRSTWIPVTMLASAISWPVARGLLLPFSTMLTHGVTLIFGPLGNNALLIFMSIAISAALAGAVGGGLIGLTQWTLLRSKTADARHWIGAVTMSWLVVWGVSWGLLALLLQSLFQGWE